MIKYKRVDAKNGRTMYYKNGKMVGKEQVPVGIRNNLENGVELTTDTPDPASAPQGGNVAPGGTVAYAPEQTVDESSENSQQLNQDKGLCIFCGETATRKRFVNLQTAELCDDDYNNHTTGEIAAQMREVAAEK